MGIRVVSRSDIQDHSHNKQFSFRPRNLTQSVYMKKKIKHNASVHKLKLYKTGFLS